jgi:hypothetical protein
MEETTVTFCPHNPDEQRECAIDTCPCCFGLGVAARCPGCDGAGAILVRTLREAQLAHQSQFERCEGCKGRGWFPITTELYKRLGFYGEHPEEYYYRSRKPPANVRPIRRA